MELSHLTKHVHLKQKILCSPTLQSYEAEKGINAPIHNATVIPPSSPPANIHSSPNQINSILHHDFLSLLSYSNTATDSASGDIHANMACNNKDDALIQSQMFNVPNTDKFIQCQKDEIEGLTKFDVMDIHHISDLPP
jgi:hypothetical protein